MHLDLVHTVTVTRFTAAALDIKAEPAVLVAALLGIGRIGIKRSYEIEYADICSGITPRSPSDGRLVDNDYLIEITVALYIVTLDLLLSGTVPAVLRPVRLSLSTPTLDCSPALLFSAIRKTFLGHIEFAPHGDSGVATSLCAEWALTDGNMPVTTVSGVGGYASLSDLTVFLRSIRRRRPAEEQLPAQELLARLSEAFPQENVARAEMKVSPSSSIHILKFRLEQLGFGNSPAKLKTLSSKIRAGHRSPSPYLDGEAIYAVSRQID